MHDEWFMDFHSFVQRLRLGLDRRSGKKFNLWGCGIYSLRETALLAKVEALRWTMKNMLQHSTFQSFGTDCKDLIAMIKEHHSWPSFCNRIGGDKDSANMFSGLQDLLHRKNAKWNSGLFI